MKFIEIFGRMADRITRRPILVNKDGRLIVGGQMISARTTKTLAATTDYAAEDVMNDAGSTAWVFKNVVENSYGAGYIVSARVLISTTDLSPRLTLYLFSATPTSALADNAANTTLLAADLQLYIGKIDFPGLEDLGGFSEALVTPSTYGNLPLAFSLADAGNKNLYGILVTRDAITGEAANMTGTVHLMVEPA